VASVFSAGIPLLSAIDPFNSDQGGHFVNGAWIDVLTNVKTKNNMDGKDVWCDKRMIERLWRSLKHELVYLNAVESG